MDIKQALIHLCETPAVTGFEHRGSKAAAALLAQVCTRVETDRFGNVYGFLDCQNPDAKTVLLDAHLDQIGFLVTEVLEKGFLRFAAVGGVDPRMLLGCEVQILTPEPVFGLISCMPPHLLKAGEQDKTVPISEMVIDTGLLDAKEKIQVGQPIVFAEPMVQLADDTLTGKCLDDRAGVLAIVHALEKLSKKKLAVNVVALISVQEETSSLGAEVGAYRVRPDYAIAVDVSHAKTTDAPAGVNVFSFGGGPIIGMGPNLNKNLTRALIRTAKTEEIDFQREVMEGNTGTNAWNMQIVACGTAMGLVSIPEKYMHTPIESVKLSDVRAVGELLYHFIRNFDGEVRL